MSGEQETRAGPRIRTPRLELIAATASLARADADRDDVELADLLDAQVAEGWPPGVAAEAMPIWAETLAAHPEQAGWWAWYFVRDEPHWGLRTLIGGGGFQGPPSAEGVVEIGFAVLPSYQLRGLATEAMQALVDWAFADRRVELVLAETYPYLAASVAVIGRLGMTYAGIGLEGGAIRFGLSRADYVRRRAGGSV
jgi:RimJ/RimL family protein N-acetyltransferase